MDILQFINEAVFRPANAMLDVAFLGGGIIALLAYPVYFFFSNLKKYTEKHKSGELLSHTLFLVLVCVFAAALWALPEIILAGKLLTQKISSPAHPMTPAILLHSVWSDGKNGWRNIAWLASTVRWGEILLFLWGIAYGLGHEHGKNRWARSASIITALIILGWTINRWLGLLCLSLPLIVAYYAMLHDVALVTMPASNAEDKAEQRKRISAFISYTWGVQSPMTVVDDHAWKTYEPRISGDFTWDFSDFPIPLLNKLDRPGVIWTRSHQAAAISGGTQFKRIENPGVSFTGSLERLDQVFDLRMQLRSREIEVVSKDGIRFFARYFTAFRLDNQEWDEPTYKKIRLLNPSLRGADKLSYTGSFPFSHKRVQATLGVTSTKAEEGSPIVPWDRWVMSVIEDQTRKVVSQKNLDELWRPVNDDKFANALDIIADEIKKNSETTLRAAGILLAVARVVDFRFPTKESEDETQDKKKDEAKENGDKEVKQQEKKELDDITRQQIASWQSAWAQKRKVILARAEARAIQLKEEARVYAEGQLIESIVNSLEKAHRNGMSRQVIAMRFLSALQDYTHRHLAGEGEENEELKRKMSQLRGAFKQWQEDFFAEG